MEQVAVKQEVRELAPALRKYFEDISEDDLKALVQISEEIPKLFPAHAEVKLLSWGFKEHLAHEPPKVHIKEFNHVHAYVLVHVQFTIIRYAVFRYQMKKGGYLGNIRDELADKVPALSRYLPALAADPEENQKPNSLGAAKKRKIQQRLTPVRIHQEIVNSLEPELAVTFALWLLAKKPDKTSLSTTAREFFLDALAEAGIPGLSSREEVELVVLSAQKRGLIGYSLNPMRATASTTYLKKTGLALAQQILESANLSTV